MQNTYKAAWLQDAKQNQSPSGLAQRQFAAWSRRVAIPDFLHSTLNLVRVVKCFPSDNLWLFSTMITVLLQLELVALGPFGGLTFSCFSNGDEAVQSLRASDDRAAGWLCLPETLKIIVCSYLVLLTPTLC